MFLGSSGTDCHTVGTKIKQRNYNSFVGAKNVFIRWIKKTGKSRGVNISHILVVLNISSWTILNRSSK